MMPYFYIHVVYDEKCDNQYQCCYQSGEVEGMYYDINYYNPNNDFNEAASKYAYPDVSCRFRYLTSGNCEVVCVWQDSNNDAIAMYGYYPNRQQVNLGPCRDPTMRGISVDMTDVQYYQFPGNRRYQQDIRKSWTNPGGITVIWRSGAINQSTTEYYGIDTQVLEWKNSTFRVCHDYYDTGTDDSNPGDSYQQAIVTHETNSPNDIYLDISSEPDGDSHITRENSGAIWYYTKNNYRPVY